MFLIVKVNFIKENVFSGKFMVICYEAWGEESCVADAEKACGYPLLRRKKRIRVPDSRRWK